MKKINIVHLYPEEMNMYGDSGNVLVLAQRLKWRNIGYQITRVGVGETIPIETHIVVAGGGQDANQQTVASDLQRKAVAIKKLADNEIPMLMICGMYQLFGHYFKNANKRIKGIGLFDMHTIAESNRPIGNISIKTKWGEIVGYENHSGRTYLDSLDTKFGAASLGMGNNGKDKTEGAIYKNVFGSYLHGPLLAKAPEFADYLLSLALLRAGSPIRLDDVDDKLEYYAASVAKKRRR